MVGLFSECLDAVRTTAEVNLLTRDFFLGCQMPWFFRQASGTYNKVTDLREVFLRIRNKYVNAPLAAEVVFLTFIERSGSFILADLQPDK